MADGITSTKLNLRDLDREPRLANPFYVEGAVAPGKKVTLHFALKLNDSAVVDSNFDKEPVSFIIGDGNMLPGFECALLSLKEGDSVEATIAAEQAFGPVNPDNQQRFPRFHFPPDLALSENLMIEFTDASGYKQAGRVLNVTARDVEIDFNHPLAGRDILFSARIYKVETPAEPAVDAGSQKS